MDGDHEICEVDEAVGVSWKANKATVTGRSSDLAIRIRDAHFAA